MRAAQRLTAVLGPSRSGDDATCDARNTKRYKKNVIGVALLGVLEESENDLHDWRCSSDVFACSMLATFGACQPSSSFLGIHVDLRRMYPDQHDQCNLSISVSSLPPSVPSQNTEALRKSDPQGRLRMGERLKVCRFRWHPEIRQAKLLKASGAGHAAAGRCTTRLIADFCERCFGLSPWKHV